MNDVSSAGSGAAGLGAAGKLALPVAALLLAVACGASRTDVRTAPVASLSDAISCAVERGEAMGFEVVSLDRDDHRVVLERTDESVSRSDPTFQRAVDQVVLEPAGTASGAPRAVSAEARTFYEYFDRRGRTRRQREPSEGVLAAADALLARCASDGAGEAGSGAGG